jgi:hypothetical protein
MTMAMSMYGIPNTVSDACGTFGPTFDEELCARWMQTSAFLPLIRNYWTTTYFNTTGFLDNQTISLNATHAGALNVDYLTHNANGHMGLKRLWNVLTTNTSYSQWPNRALVFSESTFPGSGSFGAALISYQNRTW